MTVKGRGSEEVLEVTPYLVFPSCLSLFSYVTDGFFNFVSIEEVESAPIVSVRREKCGEREESGGCNCCFYSI